MSEVEIQTPFKTCLVCALCYSARSSMVNRGTRLYSQQAETFLKLDAAFNKLVLKIYPRL